MSNLNNKTVFLLFLSWRLLLFVPLFLGETFLKAREGFSYTSPSYWSSISHFFLAPWANFDGVYYLYIAGSGYTVDNVGFFPVYPMIINLASLNSKSFSFEQFFVALILSSIIFLLGLLMFKKLIKLDYKEKIALSSIIFLLIFPASFFFATVYSEALFFLLAVSSFYFARKKQWFLASILGLLLSATRIVGIAIFPALLLEFYLQNKTLFSRKVFSIFLSPLGFIFYSLFNYFNFGNAFQFIKAQGNLANERSVDQIILFPQTLFRYFNILLNVSPSTYEWWVALLELSAFIFASLMLFFAWKKKIRASYLLFSLIAFLIPTSTGTFSGLTRYILALFPIFIAIALLKDRWIKILYAVCSVILLIILFMLFSKSYYIA